MGKKQYLTGKKKIAFVASGGAVKAACFHLGVCLALERKGIVFLGGTQKNPPQKTDAPHIRTYVGSSAGSIIVALLASGFTLKDIVTAYMNPERSTKKLPKIHLGDLFHFARPNLKRFSNMFRAKKMGIATGTIESLVKSSLSFGGFFTTVGIEQYVKKALPTNTFQDLWADLFVVASQLDFPNKSVFCKYEKMNARPEHQAIYDSTVKISHACAASTALPPIYQPYLLNSKKEGKKYYFDGEIKETLSTHVAKDMGADLVIASYTHQPYQLAPEIGSLADYGISHVVIQAIYQLIEQKIHTSKRLWQTKTIAMDTVNQFLIENNFDDTKRKELCDKLAKKMQYNPDIPYIFIHPLPTDYALFLSDHFSLSKDYMIKMVQSGFKAGIYHLRNIEFVQ